MRRGATTLNGKKEGEPTGTAPTLRALTSATPVVCFVIARERESKSDLLEVGLSSLAVGQEGEVCN
jgi:hypothetical protein